MSRPSVSAFFFQQAVVAKESRLNVDHRTKKLTIFGATVGAVIGVIGLVLTDRYYFGELFMPVAMLVTWYLGWNIHTRCGGIEGLEDLVLLCAVGVAPNTILGAFVGALVGTVARAGRPPVQGGHCRFCNYDLKGNVSGICPECGQPVLKKE